MKYFDTYSIQAHYVPLAFMLIPAMIYGSTFDDNAFSNLFKYADFFIVVKNISLSLVVVFFLMKLIRIIARLLEDQIFSKKMNFPTTRFLLWDDMTLSKEIKTKLHAKIKKDFDVNLLDEHREATNIEEAKRTAKDAVDLIRPKVKNGIYTFSNNVQYGFVKNLLAGIFISMPFSIINIYVFWNANPLGLYISSIFLILSLLLLAFSKTLMQSRAEYYADTLLKEYLYLGGKE